MALFRFKSVKADILLSLNVEVNQDGTGAPVRVTEDDLPDESSKRVTTLIWGLVQGLSVNSKAEFEALFAT